MRASSGTINAGDMRKVIVFQNNTPVANNSGGFKDNWTTFYTCRARFRPMSGIKLLEGQQIVQTDPYEVVCRFTIQIENNVNAKTTIVIDGTTYVIKKVQKVDDMNHWYQFIVTAKTPG